MDLLWHIATMLGSSDLLQYSATILGNGQWNSQIPLPHCCGAVGSGTPSVISVHCHTEEHWAVDLLQYSATLLRISGQLGSFGTMPYCWGGSGQWDSFSTATLLGSGRWISIKLTPHLRGALGSGSPAVHCHTPCFTAQGQVAGGVDILDWPFQRGKPYETPSSIRHFVEISQRGSLQKEPHCPLPQCSEAVYRRSPGAHEPQVVRQRRGGVPLPTAPRQCGSVQQVLLPTAPRQ